MSAFAARFGPLDDNRANPHLRHPDDPNVFIFVNKEIKVKDKTYKGALANKWHTDLSYTDRPATATFLNGKDLPDVGGDTMFANMYMAYETLSPAFQRMIDPLSAIHDAGLSTNYANYTEEEKAERNRINPPVVHPVVRVHPETGRKALYVGSRVRAFLGMTEEENPILCGTS